MEKNTKIAIVVGSFIIFLIAAYVIYKGGISEALGLVTDESDPDGIESFKKILIENRAGFDNLMNEDETLFDWQEGSGTLVHSDRNENVFKMKAALVDLLESNPSLFKIKAKKNISNFKAKDLNDYDLFNTELLFVLNDSFGWTGFDKAKFSLIRTKAIAELI